MHYIILLFVALSTAVGGYVVYEKDADDIQEKIEQKQSQESSQTLSQDEASEDGQDKIQDKAQDTQIAVAVIPIKKEPELKPQKHILLIRPSIDIARIEQDGDAVIAGRGTRGSFVKILADSREIGVETVDDKGEWLYVSDKPINEGKPGAVVISLIGISADGLTQVNSSQTVTVLIPEKEKKPLVIAQDESRVTQILQKPKPVEDVENVSSHEHKDEDHTQYHEEETLNNNTLTKQAEKKLLKKVKLQINVFDYFEDTKMMFVSGVSQAGSLLRLYVDNVFQLDIVASQEGTFEGGKVIDALSVGNHALRLDEIDEKGSVVDRIEVSFEKKKEKDVVVQIVQGDNLWNIARRIYGKGLRYTVIYEANKNSIKDPNLIYPGQVFVAPRKEDLQ